MERKALIRPLKIELEYVEARLRLERRNRICNVIAFAFVNDVVVKT